MVGTLRLLQIEWLIIKKYYSLIFVTPIHSQCGLSEYILFKIKKWKVMAQQRLTLTN